MDLGHFILWQAQIRAFGETMTARLKPLGCPFCGELPEVRKHPRLASGHRGGVECINSRCTAYLFISAPTIEEAIERWNTRAPAKEPT